ncbi:MAG TPA: GntR family transcriptional regulator [Synergistetes bacterium]|nr:GntR family transcriptional regulator [Synergistota bacterium]
MENREEILSVKSLREQVYEYIRKQLDGGQIRPGAPLNLNEMSERLGISKTPLREALIQLEVEGFVTFYPRKGILVNALTETDIRHAYEIIGALESSVILWNFHRFDEEVIAELEQKNTLMQEALRRDDFEVFYEHNLSFHNAFLSFSDNVSLKKIVMNYKARLYDFPRRKGFVKEWEVRSTGEHKRFIELIKMNDARGAAEYFRDVHWSFEVQKPFIDHYYIEMKNADMMPPHSPWEEEKS